MIHQQAQVAVSFVLVIACYLWLFWGMYVLVMGLYRAYLSNRLNKVTIALGLPFIAVGLVIDVLANLVIGTVIFVDMPCEFFFTDRLRRYILTDDGWRKKIASFVCEKLLDVFDPTGKHCS